MISRARIVATRDRARRASRVRMVDVWRVTRQEGDFDDVTGEWDDEPTVVYEGRAWFGREGLRQTANVEKRADQPLTTDSVSLIVPHTAGPFLIGDICQPVTSDEPHQGRVWRVTAVPSDSWQIDRQLEVEEVLDGA
jgi:hypothetical protein